MNDLTQCIECKGEIPRAKRGDFFGCCSWRCLSIHRERIEAQTDEHREPEKPRTLGGSLFGSKGIF